MKDKINIFLIFLITIISRLPFIWNSPGVDPDNWLVLFTGQEISRTGVYAASRLPGYPLSEYSAAFLGPKLWWVINIITVIFSAFAMVYFYKILYFFNLKNKMLSTIALAFTQGIFIASTVNMEYMWSIFFLLAATYNLLKSKYIISGIFIGLMVATRFTNIVLLLPLLYLILYSVKEKNLFKITLFFIVSAFTFGICFIVVFRKYGLNLFPSEIWILPDFKAIISLYTLHLYGFFGFLGILISILYAFINFKKIRLKLQENKALLTFCLLVIIMISIVYFRFPFESYYNLPLVPFLIIILNIILISDKIKKVVFFLIIISPFTGYISLNKIQLKGCVFVNEKMENDFLDYTKKIHQNFINKKAQKKILVAGGFYHAYKCIYNTDNYEVLKTPSKENIKLYISKGYTIYYPMAIKDEILELKHYDITKFGENILPPLIYDR